VQKGRARHNIVLLAKSLSFLGSCSWRAAIIIITDANAEKRVVRDKVVSSRVVGAKVQGSSR
jgi:predicted aconitase with swiveling domain